MKAIFTFHSIDNSNSVLSFKPASFRQLIHTLLHNDIPILTMDDLLKQENKKGIAITFDDGMLSVYTEALSIIREFNIPAHLFLTTSVVGKDNYWPTQPQGAPKFPMMNWQQVLACQAAGFSIDAHSHTHPHLNNLSLAEIHEECIRCDELIENKTGLKPNYFAYPYGSHDEQARQYVKTHYKASVTTFMRPLSYTDDLALLPRLDSYYLRSQWLHSQIGRPLGNTYLMMRSLIRSLRGHQ